MSTRVGNESSLFHGLADFQDSRSIADFLEVAFDAIVILDLRNQITYWNPAAEQMFGWKAQEALGKTPAELFWPLSTSRGKKTHQQRQLSLTQDAVLRGEFCSRRKDRSDLWVQYTAQAILDENRKITGYLTLFRDISVRVLLREKEKELERSNTKLNEILESIQDDFYVLDRDWNFVFTSRLFTSKIGKEPRDFVGKNIWEMFPKHLGTALEENFRAAMEKREIRTFEISGKYTDAWYRIKTFPSAEGITVLGTDITEQRRAQQAAIESRRKYQDLLETTSDFIWEMDSQGRYTYCSPQIEKLWGLKPQDMIGKTPFDVMPPEEKDKALEAFKEVATLGAPFYGLTTAAFNSQKQLISIETSGVPFFDQDGGLLGFRGITRDITERKRTEEQLRELSQRLTYHVDNSPLAVIEWGPDMRLIRWSGAAEQIFGWKADEVLGKRIEDFRWVYDEDTEQVRDVSFALQTGTDPRRFSLNRNYRKDGSVAYCEWYNSSLVDESGHLQSILSLVLDVTQSKRAEQALRESEERYRHLVKYAPTGIYEIDIKTMRFMEVNDSMCQMLGYTHEELLSKMPDELLNEEGRERFRERMLKMLAGEKVPPQTEYLVKTKDGREIWGLLTITINYDNGKPRSVSVIAYDITERKHQEELSRALNSVNDAIHSILDLNEVMQRAMNQAASALSCDTAAISLREGNRWIVRYVHGLPQDVIGMQMSDEEERHAVLAVQTKLPVAINDAFHDERFNRDHFQTWGIRSVLVVPLIIGDEANGAIFFNYQQSQNIFADYQIDFAVKLSASLALALENARLLGDLQTELAERKRAEEALRVSEQELQLLNHSLEQKVQEKTTQVRRLASDLVKAEQRERSRISHILHDDLQQRIYALQMELMCLRDALEEENETARQEMSNIERQMEEIRQGIRHLSIELSPPILQDEGLSQAIHWLAVQMRQQYGLPIEVHADGTFALSDQQLHVLLFNCVRELLFNVVKHARASRAAVALQWSDAGLRIEVQDDGKGFPVIPQKQAGQEAELPETFGLPTIRHQLSLFGGHMEIVSEPGAGTRITLVMPVADKGA